MNNISTDELEQKIAAGEEIVDQYFDPTSTRVGTPQLMTARRSQNSVPTPVITSIQQTSSIWNLGSNPVECDVKDGATNHDHYL
ncbi:hypothetical protein ACSQ6I_03240 [Anabaena sp. WFMT]|uniref:hypothetical protein n=1 Tax=Anabaena sp. WFMT TaxID=3449730 RepID=UPI003F214316